MSHTKNKVFIVGGIQKIGGDESRGECWFTVSVPDPQEQVKGVTQDKKQLIMVVASEAIERQCKRDAQVGRRVYIEGRLERRGQDPPESRYSTHVRAEEFFVVGNASNIATTKPGADTSASNASSSTTVPPQRRECDWCGSRATYTDEAYELCRSCRDQMYGY